MAVLDRFTKILTREVHFSLGSEGLRFRVRKGSLCPGEKAWLEDHRDRLARELLARNIHSCGGFLLQTLWWAGYRLRLIPSDREARYTVIPTGQPTNEVDFPTLFQLYEVHHDEGVNLLLDACRIERIDPERWHEETPKLASIGRRQDTEGWNAHSGAPYCQIHNEHPGSEPAGWHDRAAELLIDEPSVDT